MWRELQAYGLAILLARVLKSGERTLAIAPMLLCKIEGGTLCGNKPNG